MRAQGQGNGMAKKSFMTKAQDAITDAAKTGAAGAKDIASEAAAAAAMAAAGVVVEKMKTALERSERKLPVAAVRKPAKKKPAASKAAKGKAGKAAKKSPKKSGSKGSRKKRR
jgi:hypothetical protein